MTAKPAVLSIALVAGTLDIGENLIFNHRPVSDGPPAIARRATEGQVFQYIASGLIGPQAAVGSHAVALGVLIHYLIALSWTALFYAASRRWAILRRRPVAGGLLFGLVVYLWMNLVVLPLTRVPHAVAATTLASRLSGLFAVLVCIGLTISLLMRKFFPPI